MINKSDLMNCCALEQHGEMIKHCSQKGAAWLITIKAMRMNTLGTVHNHHWVFHHGR